MTDNGAAGPRLHVDILKRIGEVRLIPVLRCRTGKEAHDLAAALLDGGETLVEVAATTPNWLVVVRELRATWPRATIGVGTVLTASDAQAALGAGVDFLVSPHLAPLLRKEFGEHLIEGGFTPGEIVEAASYGLAKLFPAHVGGTQYLRSLLAVYPERRIMPTGGLQLNEAEEWLSAGAYAVGIGSGFTEMADPLGALRGVRLRTAALPVEPANEY